MTRRASWKSIQIADHIFEAGDDSAPEVEIRVVIERADAHVEQNHPVEDCTEDCMAKSKQQEVRSPVEDPRPAKSRRQHKGYEPKIRQVIKGEYHRRR